MPIPGDDPIAVGPMPTPFREDEAVDFGAIERNVEKWLETPLSGFVLNSENGEEAFLSEAERLEIVRAVDRVRAGRRFVLAGVDNPSVKETLRLADALVEAGAELLRIRIPRLGGNVRGYFEQVVPRAAAPVVVIHQMDPGRFLSTSASLGAPAELIGDIVSMDNVFGYIMSDNLRFESRMRTLVPSDKRFWINNGSLLLPGAVLGGDGGCMMFANVAPGLCRDIIRLAIQGKLGAAQASQARILESDWQILSRGAAGIKCALDLLGFEMGAPRAPQSACSAADALQIREALRQAGLLT